MISHRQKEYMYSYTKGAPPAELKMHLHDYYEFLYFKSGDASYIVEDNIYPIDPGDIFITRPDEMHTLAFHSNAEYERHFIQISRDFLSEFNLFDKIDSRPLGTGNKVPAKLVKKYDIGSFFSRIEYYIVHRLPESDAMIKSYFIQFLVQITSIGSETRNKQHIKSKNRIDDIIDYLTYNISSDISLDFLADKFYINKYYMCHAFKENTGLTIKEFMNTRKITKAKNMLLDGSDIMSLCYECGFNDYSTFYKTFKKLTGKNPKAFIKQEK